MNKIIGFLFFIFFVLSSCEKSGTREIELQIESPENSYFEIHNKGKSTALYSFENNNMGVYDIDKMVLFINNHYHDMPIAEKVWRFIAQFTKHKSLITKNNWLYNPLLLVNSAGGSFCGYRSAAMTNILLYMGIKARSWCIEGHVITEAYVDGRWQVYDPDLGVVYYNENGNICSFCELSDNPLYITNPIKMMSVSSYCDSVEACSKKIADMYTSKNDNCLFNTYYEHFNEKQKVFFMLPKGSVMTFPMPDNSKNTTFALAELKLPKNWTGNVKMSLIPFDYIGDAEIEYQNKIMKSDYEFWADKISASQIFEDEIVVKQNPEGVVLRYHINPYIYSPKERNSITLIGKGVRSLEVGFKEYSISQQPNWLEICNDNFIDWLKYLALDTKIGKIKVDNFDDYMTKIKSIEKHGAFSKFNIDNHLFYNQLNVEFINHKNRDIEFWQQFENQNIFVHSLLLIINKIENVSE